MSTNIIPQQEIEAVANTYLQLSQQYTTLLESMTETALNTKPDTEGWTAAQVVQHIVKANNSKIFTTPGQAASRNISERIPELRQLFLNFDIKMKSPEFILPEDKPYSKEVLINAVKNAFKSLAEALPQCNLNEEDTRTLGNITKWEMANFIVFHSQRHLHQLEEIYKSLKTKNG
ncbi:MAG TPA: DinB family protein [Ferruginibacter sp.]|nr:DinB family protein [Ferruginibacter sp.]HMP20351.1 DinB family protein [Ferruginibacter sp.]